MLIVSVLTDVSHLEAKHLLDDDDDDSRGYYYFTYKKSSLSLLY